jgi:hypothetical protein
MVAPHLMDLHNIAQTQEDTKEELYNCQNKVQLLTIKNA